MSQAQIDEIFALLDSAAKVLIDQDILPNDWQNNSQITRSKSPEHGDYASNIALTAAKAAKSNPRALAEQLIAALPDNDSIAKLEVAGPGFINIFLNTGAKFAVLDAIFDNNERYGLTDEFSDKKIQVAVSYTHLRAHET